MKNSRPAAVMLPLSHALYQTKLLPLLAYETEAGCYSR